MTRRRLALAAALAVLAVLALPRATQAQAGSWSGIFGARYGGAQRLSAYLGPMRMTRDGMEAKTGVTLELEGGQNAGQVGIGMLSFGQITPVYRWQAVGMRTWKREGALHPNQSYLGGEIQVAMVLGASYGYYFRVSGDAPGEARYHALRLVVGF